MQCNAWRHPGLAESGRGGAHMLIRLATDAPQPGCGGQSGSHGCARQPPSAQSAGARRGRRQVATHFQRSRGHPGTVLPQDVPRREAARAPHVCVSSAHHHISKLQAIAESMEGFMLLRH